MTLDKAASDTVTIDYATADGTAAAGHDYTSASGSLSFSAGETGQTVSVSIADDVVNESDETFTLTLFERLGRRAGNEDGDRHNRDPLRGRER